MKKGFVLWAFLFVMVLWLGVVSAAGATDAVETVRSVAGTIGDSLGAVVEALQPGLKYLLGKSEAVGSFGADEIFFGKILIFILLLSVVWVVAERIPLFKDNTWTIWVVSIVVPMMGVRFITSEMVLAAVWPSSAFAVAVVPLLIVALWFGLVEFSGFSRTSRKIAWLFLACVLLGVYFVRFSDMGSFAWWYLVAALASIAFLFFDGTIQNAFSKSRLENLMSLAGSKAKRDMLRDYHRLGEDLRDNIIDRVQYVAQVKALRDEAAARHFDDLVSVFR